MSIKKYKFEMRNVKFKIRNLKQTCHHLSFLDTIYYIFIFWRIKKNSIPILSNTAIGTIMYSKDFVHEQLKWLLTPSLTECRYLVTYGFLLSDSTIFAKLWSSIVCLVPRNTIQLSYVSGKTHRKQLGIEMYKSYDSRKEIIPLYERCKRSVRRLTWIVMTSHWTYFFLANNNEMTFP